MFYDGIIDETEVNFGRGNTAVSLGTKPLPQIMLNKICASLRRY